MTHICNELLPNQMKNKLSKSKFWEQISEVIENEANLVNQLDCELIVKSKSKS